MEYDKTAHATPMDLQNASIELVIERCSSCHARKPSWDGLAFAPKGIYAKNKSDVLRHAERHFLASGCLACYAARSGNLIEDEERAMLAAWRNMINHRLVDRGI